MKQYYALKNDTIIHTTRRPNVSLKHAIITADPHFIATSPPTHYIELPLTYYSSRPVGTREALTHDDPRWQPLPLPLPQ